MNFAPFRSSRALWKALALSTAGLSSSYVDASEPGDFALTVGWIGVEPHSSSGPLRLVELNGAAVNVPQPGTGASVASVQTLIATASYAVTPNAWLQLVLGWPVEQQLRGDKLLSSFGVIGEGKLFSPALLLKYQPSDRGAVRPFVSGGLTHTTYRDLRITNEAFRVASYGPLSSTSASAKSTISPVFNAGVDVTLSSRWFLNSTVTYNPRRATVRVRADNTPLGSLTSDLDLKLRTVSASLAIGYRF